MNNEIVTDKTYLSEIMSILPSGILLNKGVTGCGGTYVELHSKRNSIILVPTIELANNKAKPEYLIVHGKVKEVDIKQYINSVVKYKKIIGTYDSLKKILSKDLKEYFLKNYFLLIDEYHILFNAYSYRNEPITFILNNYINFKDFCFMTATPLSDDIILEEIKELPRMNITWERAINIKLNLIDASFTNKELIKIILQDNKNVNYHIFLNSVKTIKDIVQKNNLIDYKVVCSEKARSNNKTLKTGTTLDPPYKLNFYTATAFEGCDIYDPIGKTIILCDTNIATTILDISTLVRQICGRLRDSIYKEEVTLILNTTKHRYANVSKEMFHLKVEENIKLGKYTENKFINDPDIEYKEKELRSYNPETYNSFYVNRFENTIFYDDNFRKMDVYNYRLINDIYNSSISVIKEASTYNIDVNNTIVNSSWITDKLENREYTYKELEEVFSESFKNKSLTFSGQTLKDLFPPFEKTRKVKNKIRGTYYKFKI